MAQTREEKIFKLAEELKEELLAQPHLMREERWNGKVCFEFEIRDGGIFGDVSVTKHGSKKKA